jgi:hypothetical protein
MLSVRLVELKDAGLIAREVIEGPNHRLDVPPDRARCGAARATLMMRGG